MRLLFITLLLVELELVARFLGLATPPLYVVNNEIGYMLRPNQSGSALGKQWFVNGESMISKPWEAGKRGVLLLGDSIVYGGVRLDYKQKLGAKLEEEISASVWSVGANSWGAVNEIVYLNTHQQVVKNVDKIAWIINTGDLDKMSTWKSEFAHPTSPHTSALFHALGKIIIRQPTPINKNIPILEESKNTLKEAIERLSALYPKKEIIFFLYPDKLEAAENVEANAHYLNFAEALRSAIKQPVVEIRKHPQWNLSLYSDDIHPTAHGYSVLAKIIGDELKK